MMKHKLVAFLALAFFIVINTQYYWEVAVGSLMIPIMLILIVLFIILTAILAVQFYIAYRENFENRPRLLATGLLGVVLILVLLKPGGLINFEQWERKDLLIAGREGTADCSTTLKLKEAHKFKQRTVCFGVEEVTGTYRLQRDTIYFEDVIKKQGSDAFYKFAVIRADNKDSAKSLILTLYKGGTDTTCYELQVTRNALFKTDQ